MIVTYEWFRGLGDPTRLAIIGFLSQEALNVSQLVAQFDISRPAVSRHLRVLRESGLVSETRSGRERLYSVDSDMLAAAAEWLQGVAEGEGAQVGAGSAGRPTEAIAEADWRQW